MFLPCSQSEDEFMDSDEEESDDLDDSDYDDPEDDAHSQDSSFEMHNIAPGG